MSYISPTGAGVPPAGVEPAGEAVSGGYASVLASHDPRDQHQGGGAHHHPDCR